MTRRLTRDIRAGIGIIEAGHVDARARGNLEALRYVLQLLRHSEVDD